MRRLLLGLAGALVVLVIGLQARRLSQAQDELMRLEDAREAAQARAELTLQVLNDTAQRLDTLGSAPQTDTVQAELVRDAAGRLREQARILQRGDPQLLDPESNPGLHAFFEELL